MSEYISVSQFAEKFKMDVSRIRRLIAAGRIPADKIGNQWAIPKDAMPPEDARIKTGKYINWRKNK